MNLFNKFIGLLITIGMLIGIFLYIRTEYYETVFEFSESVAGLDRGSIVVLKGVPVGEITSFRLNPETKNVCVFAQLNKDKINNFDNLSASLAMNGITGNKLIELLHNEKKGYKASTIQIDGQSYLTLPTKISPTASVLAILDNVDERIINRLLTKVENLVDTSLLIVNDVQKIVDNDVQNIVNETNNSIKEFNQILGSIQNSINSVANKDNIQSFNAQINALLNGDKNNHTVQAMHKLLHDINIISEALKENPMSFLLFGINEETSITNNANIDNNLKTQDSAVTSLSVQDSANYSSNIENNVDKD